MSTLLVSGDSWTSGWPLEERLGHRNNGWPTLVANHFGFELIDKSRAGSSNYRIYRKSLESILAGSELNLVFLTSWTRFETGGVYGKKPGRIYQHLVGQDNSDLAFKNFFNGYLNYTDMLRQIISLQAIAKMHKKHCFFLDTFENNLYSDISLSAFKDILMYNIGVFDNMDDDRVLQKFKKIKDLEINIDWTKFISKDSYELLIKDCKLDKGHPVEDGHARIASIVIKFLERTYHGKTI